MVRTKMKMVKDGGKCVVGEAIEIVETNNLR